MSAPATPHNPGQVAGSWSAGGDAAAARPLSTPSSAPPAATAHLGSDRTDPFDGASASWPDGLDWREATPPSGIHAGALGASTAMDATTPGVAMPGAAAPDAAAPDLAKDRSTPVPGSAQLIGWRRRALVALAALGCLLIFLFSHHLAQAPSLPLQWEQTPLGTAVITTRDEPALSSNRHAVVRELRSAAVAPLELDAALLARSMRWQVDAVLRQRQQAGQRALAAHLQAGTVELRLANGERMQMAPRPTGYAGLGWLFWPVCAFALLLFLLGAVVWLARPITRNLMYLVLAWSQAGNLVFIAAQSVPGLVSLQMLPQWEAPLRTAFDALSAAAVLQTFALNPRLPLPWRLTPLLGWVMVLALPMTVLVQARGAWGLTQTGCAAVTALAVWVAGVSYRIHPNPLLAVTRRFSAALLGTWLLVTLTLEATAGSPATATATAGVASVLWTSFVGSVLLLTPFLSRFKAVLREFALLAGVSTVATSLDLLFVAAFSLGPFASLTLAVFLALGAYAGVRQWLLDHLLSHRALTTERTFEQIYRIAREVQQRPEQYRPRAVQLLGELFDPLESQRSARPLPQARVVGNGVTLLVPIPATDDPRERPHTAVLHFARRGQRLFSQDDARLADRVIDQLRRAVAYDQAVERGRAEERRRIAQDLHDDIGARLLTLMYQAGTPEMEDYIRHTLKDLKTLTRGLSAVDHRLSHAAAEWKADLGQRLALAHVELVWQARLEHDPLLNVVQWSSLTRVLRELVSNVIAHANARRLDVQIELTGAELRLWVQDDGDGGSPEVWSHGLGLGGVRKRVKQLGGEVHWHIHQPKGIVCEVLVRDFAGRS